VNSQLSRTQSTYLHNKTMTILLAFLIDTLWGDPPNRWHPVAWMGTLITQLRRRMPASGRLGLLLGGSVIALGGAGLVWGIGLALQRVTARLPWPLHLLAEAAVLKSTFSLRGLVGAARDVETALLAGDLPQARRWLGWHLVSRETGQLDESQVAAAAIESLAENLSDGVVAPLFYYRLGGLPAALAYRYLNTCDALLGYRDAEREWLGKVPARADDIANLIPARLTAWGILVAQRLASNFGAGANLSTAVAIYRRDCAKTTSPNAGHPMSAMAGVLGVELEKVGHYRLGGGLARPQPSDIERAVRLVYLASGLCLGAFYLLLWATTFLRPETPALSAIPPNPVRPPSR
jgi:adenosylcobinamide-phosphate synthase